MNEDKTYSVSELTKTLTEANEKIQNQENTIISLNAKLGEANTKMSEDSEQIKKLQQANLELYLKIPCNQSDKKEKGDDPVSSRKRNFKSDKEAFDDILRRM